MNRCCEGRFCSHRQVRNSAATSAPLATLLLGLIHHIGPGVANVIPESVTLSGTIRALTNAGFVRLRRRVEEVVTATAGGERFLTSKPCTLPETVLRSVQLWRER